MWSKPGKNSAGNTVFPLSDESQVALQRFACAGGIIDHLGAEYGTQPRLFGNRRGLCRKTENIDKCGDASSDHFELIHVSGGALVLWLVGTVFRETDFVKPAHEG